MPDTPARNPTRLGPRAWLGQLLLYGLFALTIGEIYDEARARLIAAERGWTVKPDGTGWRRVVGSPAPREVVETPVIRLLLDSGAVVVCAGGGGVPVVRTDGGRLEGVEAVVDKDHTAAVLAWSAWV